MSGGLAMRGAEVNITYILLANGALSVVRMLHSRCGSRERKRGGMPCETMSSMLRGRGTRWEGGMPREIGGSMLRWGERAVCREEGQDN
jgi:hypothetical protein